MSTLKDLTTKNFLHTGGKKTTYTCTYCLRDITTEFRVTCAVCANVELCADCFSVGVDLPPHEKAHAFRVVDSLHFPIFSSDWQCWEEFLLLEGLEKFGVGNWKFVADYVGKNVKSVEDHYWDVWMGNHGYCLPLNYFSSDDSAVVKSTAVEFTADYKPDLLDGLIRNEDSSAETSSTQVLPCGLFAARTGLELLETALHEGYTRGEAVGRSNTAKETLRVVKEAQAKNSPIPGADLPGFMPLREDFDVEYENDAELMLADMEFEPEDHPSERDLKLQVVRIYNSKLDERNRRKRFAIDRGSVDFKKQQQADKRRTKDERELVSRTRMLARFHSAEDHESLVESVLLANRLRQQIEAYQLYREMGVRSLEQARHYEADRRRRETLLKSNRHKEGAAYLYAASNNGNAAGGGSAVGRRSVGRRGRGAAVEADEEEGSAADAGEKGAATSAELASSEPFAVSRNQMSKAVGAELLAEKELELCCRVPMLPLHYLALKDVLVREAYRNGALTAEGFTRVLRIDPGTPGIVFDFFVRELQLGSSDSSTQRAVPKRSSAALQLTEGGIDSSGAGAPTVVEQEEAGAGVDGQSASGAAASSGGPGRKKKRNQP